MELQIQSSNTQDETNRKLLRGLEVQVRLQRIELLYQGTFTIAIDGAYFISILQYADIQIEVLDGMKFEQSQSEFHNVVTSCLIPS